MTQVTNKPARIHKLPNGILVDLKMVGMIRPPSSNVANDDYRSSATWRIGFVVPVYLFGVLVPMQGGILWQEVCLFYNSPTKEEYDKIGESLGFKKEANDYYPYTDPKKSMTIEQWSLEDQKKIDIQWDKDMYYKNIKYYEEFLSIWKVYKDSEE